MIGALSIVGSLLAPSVSIESLAPQKIDSNQAAASDFTQVLSQVSNDAVNKLKTAEATSISGLQGKASVQQVVESVMAAEQTLHTAVAIRDKVIAAYQELSRMTI
jgi:flagellar hook-basal body complex protein FliE